MQFDLQKFAAATNWIAPVLPTRERAPMALA